MKQILVVDDDQRIAQLICKFLEKSGFAAKAVYSADDAYKILDSAKIDLIILDVMMPGTSGLEFAKTLREQKSNQPIVMLTALTEESDKKAGSAAGADRYMVKPFNPDSLLKNIKELLGTD